MAPLLKPTYYEPGATNHNWEGAEISVSIFASKQLGAYD